jgi:peptidoglycan biosynthesis protein MviN/MurJ (putative lipid II flippase)
VRRGSLRGALPSLANISVVAAAMALSKLLGFGEKRLLAEFFGATATVDIYFVTVAALSAVFYFVRELCDPVLLPWLVEHGDREERSAAIGAVQLAVIFALGLGASAAAMLWTWPEQVATWLAPGIVGPERVQLASLLEIAGLGLPLLCLSAVTQVILNARGRFGWAASADVVMKAVLMGGVVLAGTRDQFLLLGLASAGAALARLVAHWPVAHTLLRSCGARWQLSARDRRALWLIAAPLLAATAFSQCRELVENHFASRLGTGAIAAQGYAKRIIEIPLVVVVQAIALVGFREMAASTAAQDGQIASKTLGCIRRILMVVLPMAALVAFFSDELVTAALGAKSLDPEGRRLTAAALAMYGLALPVLAIEPALLAAYYALRNTRAPLIAGIVALPVEVSLLVVATNGWGIRAIAGAILGAKAAKLACLCCLLPREVRRASAVQARATLAAPLAAFAVTCAISSALRSVTTASLGWEFRGAALASAALFAGTIGAAFFGAEHLLARRWPPRWRDEGVASGSRQDSAAPSSFH